MKLNEKTVYFSYFSDQLFSYSCLNHGPGSNLHQWGRPDVIQMGKARTLRSWRKLTHPKRNGERSVQFIDAKLSISPGLANFSFFPKRKAINLDAYLKSLTFTMLAPKWKNINIIWAKQNITCWPNVFHQLATSVRELLSSFPFLLSPW